MTGIEPCWQETPELQDKRTLLRHGSEDDFRAYQPGMDAR